MFWFFIGRKTWFRDTVNNKTGYKSCYVRKINSNSGLSGNPSHRGKSIPTFSYFECLKQSEAGESARSEHFCSWCRFCPCSSSSTSRQLLPGRYFHFLPSWDCTKKIKLVTFEINVRQRIYFILLHFYYLLFVTFTITTFILFFYYHIYIITFILFKINVRQHMWGSECSTGI